MMDKIYLVEDYVTGIFKAFTSKKYAAEYIRSFYISHLEEFYKELFYISHLEEFYKEFENTEKPFEYLKSDIENIMEPIPFISDRMYMTEADLIK